MGAIEATIVDEAFYSVHVRRAGVLLAMIVLNAAENEYVSVGCLIVDDRHSVIVVTFSNDCVHCLPRK